MKRALLLMALVLASCAAIGDTVFGPPLPDWAHGVKTASGWALKPERGPGVAISSPSADITAFTGPCRLQEIAAGPKRAIACKSPSEITLENTGADISVRQLQVAP